MIKNIIGKMIKIDDTTLDQAKGKYVRIYVKLDPSKPILSKLLVKGKIYYIEYQTIHMLCFHCGKVLKKTGGVPPTWEEQVNDMERFGSKNFVPQSNLVYENWMLV